MSIGLPRHVATYDVTEGNDVSFYNDASENAEGTAGAFADLKKAIDEAAHFIFVADWSFHPYMRLQHQSAPKEASTIGALLIRKANANREMLIAIHTWDHTSVGAPDLPNDDGDKSLDQMTQRLNGSAEAKRPPNLLWRASSRTGFGWSHHQKFVVLDAPSTRDRRRRLKVFFGGLDVTKGRFDWPEHPILPAAKTAHHFLEQVAGIHPGTEKKHNYDDWYSPEFADNRQLVRQPWHDIHAQLVGPAVWDFLREFVGRWNLDPSLSDAQGDDSSKAVAKVLSLFQSVFNHSTFVQQWEPHGGSWQAQVTRSMIRSHWGSETPIVTPYKKGKRQEFLWRVADKAQNPIPESSIQEAYLQAIRAAERFIYIETQFFIGSGRLWNRASVRNRIPETLVERILFHKKAGRPFHVYIVLPMFPEGDPTTGPNKAQRRFQWSAIATMIRYIGSNWQNYLSFYFLAKGHNQKSVSYQGDRPELVASNRRYMIYVHSKMMIVDDERVIIGSANLNERSLAGDRDSEIAVLLWPGQTPEQKGHCLRDVQGFRQRLWQEHLGSDVTNWQQPESLSCIKAIQETALTNYINFRIGQADKSRGHLCLWRIEHGGGFGIYVNSGHALLRSEDTFIPDRVLRENSDWMWIPSDRSFIERTDIAE